MFDADVHADTCPAFRALRQYLPKECYASRESAPITPASVDALAKAWGEIQRYTLGAAKRDAETLASLRLLGGFSAPQRQEFSVQARKLFDLEGEYTAEELRSRYRRLMMVLHPDRAEAAGLPGAKLLSQLVNVSYDILRQHLRAPR